MVRTETINYYNLPLSELIEKRGGVVVLHSHLLNEIIYLVRDKPTASRITDGIWYTLKELHVLYADGKLCDPETVKRIHSLKRSFPGMEFIKAPEPNLADPRPDLTEDTRLWNLLLRIAQEEDYDIARILHGLRENGLRLVRGQVNWTLRPEVSDRGFESQEQYDNLKNKYLVPVQGKIINWLTRLGGVSNK